MDEVQGGEGWSDRGGYPDAVEIALQAKHQARTAGMAYRKASCSERSYSFCGRHRQHEEEKKKMGPRVTHFVGQVQASRYLYLGCALD